MTTTDELRRLLDERGVEYETYIEQPTGFEHVRWNFNEHGSADFNLEFGEPWLTMYGTISGPEQAIDATLGPQITGETSDGYHTFNELYHHRAVLFSVIVRDHPEIAWKARKHHDGSMYDGMFIVGVSTPQGQATYHYDLDPYWSMFECKELERAPEWDGHTPDDAIARIATLGRDGCKIEHRRDGWYCTACGDLVGSDDPDSELFIDGNVIETWDYCPSCGRAVRR